LDRVGVWTDLVDPLLAAETSDLPGLIMFLDPEAWRALLPAWMAACLRSNIQGRTLKPAGQRPRRAESRVLEGSVSVPKPYG
jgi:hypothetical protein